MTISWHTVLEITKTQQLLLGAGIVAALVMALSAGAAEPTGACYGTPPPIAISAECDQLTRSECEKKHTRDEKNYGFWKAGECDKTIIAVRQLQQDRECLDDESFQYKGGELCKEKLRKSANRFCAAWNKSFDSFLLEGPHTFFEYTPGSPPQCVVECTALFFCSKPMLSSTSPSPSPSSFLVAATPLPL